MTVLVWDEVGERRYQTGIDHGVLYPPDGGGVPWNGLVSVTENLGREVKSYYTDGVKYLDHIVPGAYSATMQAYTYPDELDELTGVETFAPGVFLHDQRSQAFSLSYRSKIGDDLDPDLGYKIHVIYNVSAAPGNVVNNTISNETAAQLFEWTLNAVPPLALGIRPTSHISLDTRTLDPDLLTNLEEFLYGTSILEPDLPSFVDLLALIEEFYA